MNLHVVTQELKYLGLSGDVREDLATMERFR
jgi:hypothetical protein